MCLVVSLGTVVTMPALVIPNGYAEIGIDWLRTSNIRLFTITFGVALKATPTPAGIALDIRNAWTATGSMNGAQPTSMVAQTVHYKATYGGVALSGSAAAGWAAGGGGPTLAPPAVALVARKSTGLAGRKYRGRLMIPWCAESDIDNNGLVAGAVVTANNAGLAAFLTALGAAGRSQINGMVLLHSSATTPTAVTGLTLRTTAGTVRKRQQV